jgi:phosphoglycerate dehydrogenase-like enzyme
LKILLLPPPPHREQPWREDLIRALNPGHHLTIWDRQSPLASQLDGIDVVIDASGAPATREMADLATSVKLWQLQSVGYDNFDVEYWRKKGIRVANVPGQLSATAVAECALMLMFMLSRSWSQAQANLQEQRLYLPMGHELEHRQLALIGFGASGRELARRAKAFEMRISAIDVLPVSSEDQKQFGLEFAGGPERLDAVLGESDYISLHLPLSPQTRHMIEARRLGLMRSSAFLINVARGGLVDQQALYDALVKGRLAGAGLDVFETEPVDPHHPLLQLPNVIATPHIAGNTLEISQRRARFAAENIERIAAGQSPLNRIV